METFFSDFAITSDVVRILINMVFGLIAGAIISGGYIIGSKNGKYSKNFAITVLLLPALMTVVIPFIATDLKKAVSLAGIFALVRFRSVPGDSKDIFYVFFTLAIGIVMGLNNYALAFIATIVVTLLYILLQKKITNEKDQILKITIPEDMNYKDVFNDIFDKYLDKYSVKTVKTTNMGTLFQISYDIRPKSDIDVKAFIDEIRTRNGNLTVIVENPDDLEAQVL